MTLRYNIPDICLVNIEYCLSTSDLLVGHQKKVTSIIQIGSQNFSRLKFQILGKFNNFFLI